jgi:hypothetical protein
MHVGDGTLDKFWKGWDESTARVYISILILVKWLYWLIYLIYIHLLSETIVSNMGQKHAGSATIDGQNKTCRKFITLEQKLDVLK